MKRALLLLGAALSAVWVGYESGFSFGWYLIPSVTLCGLIAPGPLWERLFFAATGAMAVFALGLWSLLFRFYPFAALSVFIFLILTPVVGQTLGARHLEQERRREVWKTVASFDRLALFLEEFRRAHGRYPSRDEIPGKRTLREAYCRIGPDNYRFDFEREGRMSEWADYTFLKSTGAWYCYGGASGNKSPAGCDYGFFSKFDPKLLPRQCEKGGEK